MAFGTMRHRGGLLTIAILALGGLVASAPAAPGGSSVWVSAYYAGWMQGPDMLSATSIDFSAVTQVIHFSLLPNTDGTLDDISNSVTASQAAAIVQAGHAAGKPVTISVGGWDTETRWIAATGQAHRAAFIANLLALVTSRGYDGIDIDWEPISDGSTAQVASFITDLRSAIQSQHPGLTLTAAVGWQPALFAQVAGQLDQVNLMTYDMSGPWDGWVTWHNAPIYDGGATFPSTGGKLPSADGMVAEYLAAGVPAAKLGIGIDFYGYLWRGGTGTPTGGATAPRQAWTTAPALSDDSYDAIMTTYASAAVAHWDDAAQAAYLSIDNAGAANDYFISIDNEQTCAAKLAYVRNKPIGGVIIWELGGGWRKGMPVHDPLLQAVKLAAFPASAVPGAPTTLPLVTALLQNYPNPFNPATIIRFTIGREETVRLAVYDMLGREVAVLAEGTRSPGQYEAAFDARGVASGMYCYRLSTGSSVLARSMMVLK